MHKNHIMQNYTALDAHARAAASLFVNLHLIILSWILIWSDWRDSAPHNYA